MIATAAPARDREIEQRTLAWLAARDRVNETRRNLELWGMERLDPQALLLQRCYAAAQAAERLASRRLRDLRAQP